MKKILILGVVVLSLLGITSCNRDEIDTFEGVDSIYFGPSVYGMIIQGTKTVTDSAGYSFALEKASLTEVIYKIPIRVQGKVSDVDRNVKVSVDPKSTAIAGTHFELPETIKISAGKELDTIALKVHRTPDMKQKPFLLILNLEENDSFKTEMKSHLNKITGKTISFITFKLSLDDKLTQPPGWYATALGVFTAKKFYLMCELIDLKPEIFNQKLGGPGLGLADFGYYQAFMKRYLADQKAAGNTIYEEDGKEMIFP
ncbi:hypothetical protein B0A75_04290 [Flavobacterium oncorhynchi]|uniref:DUF4843 domain-containing protein n=1 Tax=Flavobacterium oncorhynchi TaxID=728056 RepID=A0A226I7U2_9FLAO|nr:DUF4843 domain-containing protein [Flavobacterium oncorhynchi]OXB02247.1 hypothetical protein B0A75_04290 [Flavobacterium oncorhynchi]